MSFCLRSWLTGFALGLSGAPYPYSHRAPVAFLYNGVRLPALPEWDREMYPYAVIYTHEDENEYVLDMYSERPTIYEDDEGNLVYGVKNGCDMMYWANIIYPGMDWPEKPYDTGFYDGWRKTSNTTALWTNTDILNEDGSVYLAASDPVPVYE